jgi:hypothetical protein
MKRNQKAWLLTWEWSGDHAAVEDRIAGILRPRLSWQIVGEIVENMYAVHSYSAAELVYWSKRPEENPYKAQWENNHCYCGHNPSLHANYVHHLKVETDRLNKTTFEKELVRGALSETVTRTILGPLSDREIGRYKP